jgi:hypothetical protein
MGDVADVRECEQCGTAFTPRREHARFCTATCRMAWNREHVGVAAAPVAAIDWSVTAMAEATARVAWAWDLPRAAAAVSESVWWITLIDATLVRYHPDDYENTLARRPDAPRRQLEETLAGLRYVRNLLGHSHDPATLIYPADGDGVRGGWRWRALPEPALTGMQPQSRMWEMTRYEAYQSRLAGGDVARIFASCGEFLEEAAAGALPAGDAAEAVDSVDSAGTAEAAPG